MSILVRAENLVEELRQLKNQTIKYRPKRAIREHYSDLHCLQKFETSTLKHFFFEHAFY